MNWTMRIVAVLALIGLGGFASAATEKDPDPAPAANRGVESRITTTEAGERVVTQEFVVEASAAQVWRHFTTVEGWTAWASPVAEIDLRAGGTIRTHYGPDAKIGDPGTNVLHIVNYVPERLLTLQAELAANWPEVMKEDADHLMNVIVLEPLGESRTRITSYGVGYRDTPAYGELLDFFIPANERLYETLTTILEGLAGEVVEEPASPAL